MSGNRVDSVGGQPYYYESKPRFVEPEFKPQFNIGAQMRVVQTQDFDKSGASFGGGLNLGVEKNFNLGEKSYLNTGANVGLYSNGVQGNLEVNYKRKNRNFTPVFGAEIQYVQGPKQHITHQLGNYPQFGELDGPVENRFDFTERHLNFNGKLGFEAKTNNQKFTFGAGVKAGYGLGSEWESRIDANKDVTHTQTLPNGETVTNVENVSVTEIKRYESGNGPNLGGYAKVKYELPKGFALKAEGEYCTGNKSAMLGIVKTF